MKLISYRKVDECGAPFDLNGFEKMACYPGKYDDGADVAAEIAKGICNVTYGFGEVIYLQIETEEYEGFYEIDVELEIKAEAEEFVPETSEEDKAND